MNLNKYIQDLSSVNKKYYFVRGSIKIILIFSFNLDYFLHERVSSPNNFYILMKNGKLWEKKITSESMHIYILGIPICKK